MLSPTSLAGLSIGSNWASPVRAVSPSQGAAQPSSQLAAPLSPGPLPGPNGQGQQGGPPPSPNLPRGSLLDISV